MSPFANNDEKNSPIVNADWKIVSKVVMHWRDCSYDCGQQTRLALQLFKTLHELAASLSQLAGNGNSSLECTAVANRIGDGVICDHGGVETRNIFASDRGKLSFHLATAPF